MGHPTMLKANSCVKEMKSLRTKEALEVLLLKKEVKGLNMCYPRLSAVIAGHYPHACLAVGPVQAPPPPSAWGWGHGKLPQRADTLSTPTRERLAAKMMPTKQAATFQGVRQCERCRGVTLRLPDTHTHTSIFQPRNRFQRKTPGR